MKKKNNISEQKVYLNKKLGGMPSFFHNKLFNK